MQNKKTSSYFRKYLLEQSEWKELTPEEKENVNPRACNDIFNKKSGMLGVTGISSDMRDIEKAANEGSEIAETALEMYAYRVKKYIYNTFSDKCIVFFFNVFVGSPIPV